MRQLPLKVSVGNCLFLHNNQSGGRMAALDICGGTEDQLKHMRSFRRKTGVPLQQGRRSPRKRFGSGTVATSTGRPVRSKHEKMCAEYLAANGVEFIYEPLLLLSGRQFRPDFYLPKLGIFIEICGYTHMPFYRDRMEEKRRVYAAQGLTVHFIEPRAGKSLKEQLDRLIKD